MKPARGRTAGILGFLKPFAPWLALSSVAGIGAGAATVALLGTINQLLNRAGGMTTELLLTFIALCIVALAGRVISDISTNLVGQRLVAEVRKDLARKILAAPIDALERYRTHRLLPVLTSDVDMISDVAFVLASTIISLAVVLGCLAYLAWLSTPLFGMVAVALVIGIAVQTLAQGRGVRGFWKAREGEETLHRAYRAISDGAKELRLHRGRRHRVYREQIERTVHGIREINWRAINTYVLASACGSGLFFLLIVLTLGWSSFMPLEPTALSGFVLVLLFMKGPVDQIAGTVPGIGRAKVAFERIADMSMTLATPEPHLDLERPVEARGFSDAIVMRGVRYRFEAHDGGEGFVLGPIDLELRRGEMVFVVGDNGSGKTTLIKLLLGLYSPQQGEILCDGRMVTPEARDDYRQMFTTVLSDFFLFEELVVDRDGSRLSDQARHYLERLEIAHKVSVKDGAFSTLDLSTGQRKRLALVHAYLEGRPVMVFDEWAADQDPTFRHLFYTELLPELRDKGHLLVVISHDDRYFHLADRVVRLRAGCVESGHAAYAGVQPPVIMTRRQQ